MGEGSLDKVQKTLKKAIEKDAPCTFDEPIAVQVSLDNGVVYKGDAIEVQPKSDTFPDGLVMVRTANSDIGVPISYIKGR